MYSLGIMLFEIGMWRNVGYQGGRRSSRPSLETHNSDPHFIEKMVMGGTSDGSEAACGGQVQRCCDGLYVPGVRFDMGPEPGV